MQGYRDDPIHSLMGKVFAFTAGVLIGWYASLSQTVDTKLVKESAQMDEKLEDLAGQLNKRFSGYDFAIGEVTKAIKTLQEKDAKKIKGPTSK